MSFELPYGSSVTDESGKPSVPFASWFSRVHNIVTAVQSSGVTTNRPTRNLWIGRSFFDTTLGIPIWYNGTIWVDATGAPA